MYNLTSIEFSTHEEKKVRILHTYLRIINQTKRNLHKLNMYVNLLLFCTTKQSLELFTTLLQSFIFWLPMIVNCEFHSSAVRLFEQVVNFVNRHIDLQCTYKYS